MIDVSTHFACIVFSHQQISLLINLFNFNQHLLLFLLRKKIRYTLIEYEKKTRKENDFICRRDDGFFFLQKLINKFCP